MRKLHIKSMALLSMLVISISAQAQSLWRETTAGMSPPQIIKIVNESHRIQDGSILRTGAKELVRLDDFREANESFNVRFYFTDENLTQVTLNLNDKRSFPSSLLVFEALADSLRLKYGKEFSNKLDRQSVLKKAEANWVSGRTNINLLLISVGDSPAILNLNYQTKVSTKTEKL